MASKKVKRKELKPDNRYNSLIVSRFINYVLRKGKKTVACSIVYGAFDIIKEKTKRDPLDVLADAINKIRPVMEIKPKRIGGAVYQVPMEVTEDRGTAIALRWIIEISKKKKGKPMKEKMAKEILDASNGEGESIRKRDSVHRMAEANKAFAHLGRPRRK